MASSTTSSIVENKTFDVCDGFEYENDDVNDDINNEEGKVNDNGSNNTENNATNNSATATSNIDHHVTQHSDPNIISDSGMMDDEDDKHDVGNDTNSRTPSMASDQPITTEQPTAQNAYDPNSRTNSESNQVQTQWNNRFSAASLTKINKTITGGSDTPDPDSKTSDPAVDIVQLGNNDDVNDDNYNADGVVIKIPPQTPPQTPDESDDVDTPRGGVIGCLVATGLGIAAFFGAFLLTVLIDLGYVMKDLLIGSFWIIYGGVYVALGLAGLLWEVMQRDCTCPATLCHSNLRGHGALWCGQNFWVNGWAMIWVGVCDMPEAGVESPCTASACTASVKLVLLPFDLFASAVSAVTAVAPVPPGRVGQLLSDSIVCNAGLIMRAIDVTTTDVDEANGEAGWLDRLDRSRNNAEGWKYALGPFTYCYRLLYQVEPHW